MRKFLLRVLFVLMLMQSCLFCPVSVQAKANKGDMAAYVETAADAAIQFLLPKILQTVVEKYIMGLTLQTLKTVLAAYFMGGNCMWFFIWFSFNPSETMSALAHAAINKWMKEATEITANFTGEQGHVTDHWVGGSLADTPKEVMGNITLMGENFSAIAYDPDEYKGIDGNHADGLGLWKYRRDTLLNDQRTLSNVKTGNWALRYRAQRRAIKALASALELKSTLDKLAASDAKFKADYNTLPSALASVASRRAQHDALMVLKLNVMAARNKMRSEAMEVDFKQHTFDCTAKHWSDCKDKASCEGLNSDVEGVADEYKWEDNKCKKVSDTTPAEPVCSAENLQNCNASSCGSLGYEWNEESGCSQTAGSMDSSENCTTENPKNCKDKASCESLTGYKWNGESCEQETEDKEA